MKVRMAKYPRERKWPFVIAVGDESKREAKGEKTAHYPTGRIMDLAYWHNNYLANDLRSINNCVYQLAGQFCT